MDKERSEGSACTRRKRELELQLIVCVPDERAAVLDPKWTVCTDF